MIDPRGMTVMDWCSQVTLTLSVYGPVPTLRDEEHWASWAEEILALPIVAATVPPGPRAFPDWRSWAERFVQVFLQ